MAALRDSDRNGTLATGLSTPTSRGIKARKNQSLPRDQPLATPGAAGVAAFYDNLAAIYRGVFNTAARVREMGGVAAYLEAHRRHRGLDREHYTILSAGCGAGLEEVELAKNGFSVAGVDISASMLEAARAHAREAEVVVDFHEGNLLELERVVSQTFDAVVCLGNVLAYFLSDEDLRGVLCALRRALKPDGILIADTMNFALLQALDDKSQPFSFSGPDGGLVRGRLVFDFIDERVTCTPRFTDGNHDVKELSVSLQPVPIEKMTRFMADAGFARVDVHYHSIGSVSYDSRNSGTIIYVAFT